MLKSISFKLLIASILVFSNGAFAVDLISISDETSAAQNSGELIFHGNRRFIGTLNREALKVAEVVINLPGKQMLAKKLPEAGAAYERVEPYALLEQSGSVFVHSNNGVIEKVFIHDDEAKTVFKGLPQGNGQISFTEIGIDYFICDEFETDTSPSGLSPEDTRYYQSLNDLTLQQVSTLQSRPGSSKVLYIDYFAGSVSGTAWQDGATIDYENYSLDTDLENFSTRELQSMYAAWAETAEDYAQFDINVTTSAAVYDTVTNRNRSKIIATSTNWRGSGGVAYVGVFGIRDDDFFNIGWTFNRGFGSMGMTHSHEAGHQMGLSHDGDNEGAYYSGHGNYGPIMGGPFGKDFVHWDRGQYPDANQTQDDIFIIASRLGLAPDDHGDSNATATTLAVDDLVGIVSPTAAGDDADVFKFTLTSSQNPQITVRGLYQQPTAGNTAGGINLSATISLRDESGNLISQKLPSSNASNNDFVFSQTLDAGTYYLTVVNQSYDSNLSTGFSEYGNAGYYQILSNITVDPVPDLIVSTLGVNSNSLSVSELFTISATTLNEGAASSSATTLRYYLSNDATISTADSELGDDAVGPLMANASEPDSIQVAAPVTPGNYFVGACVDSVNSESSAANNCSTGVAITVNALADLVVQSPAVSDSSLTPSQQFTISATTRNQGGSSSSATTLRYYLSANSVISTADTPLGTDPVGALDANESEFDSNQVAAPVTPGNYFVGACVDSVNSESSAVNNCSTGIAITVNALADLVVQTPAVSDSSLTRSQQFTISATTRNQGGSSSSATTLRYYLSANSVISTADTPLGTDSVGALDANESEFDSNQVAAPLAAGTYYVGACVDSVANESNTANNCSSGVSIEVSTIDADAYEPDNSSSVAGVIVRGETQVHSFHEPGDQDWLRFTLDSDVTSVMIQTGDAGYPTTDTVLTLYDSSLNEIEENDDIEVNIDLYSRIEMEELEAGDYYIKIRHFGGSGTSDAYNVTLSFSDASADSFDILDILPAIISAIRAK